MSTSIKRNLLWDYGGRFSTTIFSLITSIILTRLLNPSDYGVVGIAMAVSGVAGIFLNLGLSSAIVQKNYRQLQLSTIFWFNTAIAGGVALILVISAHGLANFFHHKEVESIIYFNALTLFISSLGSVPTAIMTKNMMFKKMNIRNGVIALTSGVAGIMMAYAGFGVWALVFQGVVNSILGTIMIFRMAGWLPSFSYHFASIKDGLSFGKFLFFSSVLDGVMSRLDVFIIGRVFPASTLGLYTRAQSLDSMTRNLSASSLLSVLFPAFARIGKDKEAVAAMFNNYFEIIAFVFCFIAGVGFIVAPSVFHLLFGDKWNESAIYFQLLVISGYAFPTSSLMLTVIEAMGNSKSFFKAEVWKKILVFPVYILAYIAGVKAFLLAFFVACFGGVFINMYYLRKEIAVSITDLHLRLWKYLLSGPAFAISLFFMIKPGTKLLPSLCAGALFVAGYLLFHIRSKSNGWNSVKRHIPLIKTI